MSCLRVCCLWVSCAVLGQLRVSLTRTRRSTSSVTAPLAVVAGVVVVVVVAAVGGAANPLTVTGERLLAVSEPLVMDWTVSKSLVPTSTPLVLISTESSTLTCRRAAGAAEADKSVEEDFATQRLVSVSVCI